MSTAARVLALAQKTGDAAIQSAYREAARVRGESTSEPLARAKENPDRLTRYIEENLPYLKENQPESWSASDIDNGGVGAAEIIDFRIRALGLGSSIQASYIETRIRSVARELAQDLARTSQAAIYVDLDLARVLAKASAYVDAAVLALAFGDGTLNPYINDARALIHTLIEELNAQGIDASGADLSDMEITSLDALDGTIWTSETTWPIGVAEQVQEYSREIRPGVFQVLLGDVPDRNLVRV